MRRSAPPAACSSAVCGCWARSTRSICGCTTGAIACADPSAASDRIALLEVDDATLRAYRGAWPLPRENYAVVIDALETAGAQAIGFDLLFLGENRRGSQPAISCSPR